MITTNNYFMKNILLIFLIFILYSCGEKPQILGSSYSWSNYHSTIRDIKIGDLQIRHVRTSDSSCNQGFWDGIELDGTINNDATIVIEKILKEIDNGKGKCTRGSQPASKYITLNSDGGYLVEGIALGKIFRKYQVSTSITKDQKCRSACSTAFLGGKFRDMDENALLMMHSPYLDKGYSIKCASKNEVSELKKYYIDMLDIETGNLLFDRTMKYCSKSDGWTLNPDAAEILGILKD